jgi:hypothetical protein
MGGAIKVWHLFAAMSVITAGVFLVKEALPMVKHHMTRRPSLPVIENGQFPRLDAALSSLPLAAVRQLPAILLSPEDRPVVYISGRHRLVISASMIDLLDDNELQAIIGHEIAHLTKTVRWINLVLLLLRWLQFYNPLTLLIFRRITIDTEKLCDDMAIRLSGQQLSLTSGLLKIFQIATGDACQEGPGRRQLRLRVVKLEDVANWNLVKERVKRLVRTRPTGGVPYQNFRLVITGLMLAALLFFIV